MTLSYAFRLSLYLSLGLACACLTYAEILVLPETLFFAGIVAATLVIAFMLEGRWSLTPSRANMVGLMIGGLVGLWVAFRAFAPPAALRELPAQMLLMPYFGPVLMVAMAAKLLRPKDTGDYWTLHGIALIMVGLGCAMTDGVIFLVLMVAYALLAVWNLTLFYLVREEIEGSGNPGSTRLGRTPWLWRASSWALLGMFGGFLFFLITPRSPGDKWNSTLFQHTDVQVGYSEETIDLNRTGSLSLNSEVAFRVHPRKADGEVKRDLSPDQYWRGRYYGEYSQGTWRPMESRDNFRIAPGWLASKAVWTIPPKEAIPDFGPKQYQLNFEMEAAHVGNVLASPIWWEREKPPPAVTMKGPPRSEGSWYPYRDGTFTPRNMRAAVGQHYVQIQVDRAEPEVGPPLVLEKNERILQLHMSGPTGRITDKAREILRKFIAEGKLPAEALTRPNEHAEKVARELADYLATSSEYTYSTRLERKDDDLDPIEDFLYNTKRGHCNRFASALALMLRSLKIPVRLVVGYQGAEIEPDGTFVIRESHAHAWVEVLIARPTPPELAEFTPEKKLSHWLRLDPSPEALPEEEWWEKAGDDGRSLLEEYVFGYDEERREETSGALWSWITGMAKSAWNSVRRGEWTAMMVLGGLAMLGVLAFTRFGQKSRRSSPVIASAIYARLLRCLARHGFVPENLSQTPREFTRSVRRSLQERLGPDQIVDLPSEIAERMYRDRFGETPLTQEETADMERRLILFDQKLRAVR